MKVLKVFLFLIALFIAYIVAFSFVNIWVPKNKIGVFYLNEQADAELVSRNIFSQKLFSKETLDNISWHWQRAIPHRTRLILLNTTVLTQEQDISFYLPKASYYSGLLAISPESFRTSMNIKVNYQLTSDNLATYLDTYYAEHAPDNAENIMLNLSHQIKHTIFMHTQEETFSLLEQDENLNQENWDETMASITSQNVHSALVKFPISITDIEVRTIHAPDINTYKYITHIEQSKTIKSGIESEEFTHNTLWLQQYVTFIRDLGALTKENPSTLEIIKALPPNVVKESFEQTELLQTTTSPDNSTE